MYLLLSVSNLHANSGSPIDPRTHCYSCSGSLACSQDPALASYILRTQVGPCPPGLPWVLGSRSVITVAQQVLCLLSPCLSRLTPHTMILLDVLLSLLNRQWILTSTTLLTKKKSVSISFFNQQHSLVCFCLRAVYSIIDLLGIPDPANC